MKFSNLTHEQRFGGDNYSNFKNFLQSASGILLGDNKHYLVSSRLTRILNERDIPDLNTLVEIIQQGKSRKLKEHVVDAMTTNETLWFRDGYPFSLLSEVIIPDLRQGKVLNNCLKIWSAASSSGQEAYSISIIISEYLRSNPGSLPKGVEILGTDISESMVEIAREGIYDDLALGRGLSSERKRIYFNKAENGLQVRDDVRERCRFRLLNLLESFTSVGKFDVIYCRNVLIYFSLEVKQNILTRLAGQLKPGGYLYVGGTESLGDAGELFEMIRCNPGIVYKLKK